MKTALLLIFLNVLPACGGAKHSGSAKILPGFCGSSSNGACRNDADCGRGGCSNQICQAVTEGTAISTCEFKDCYEAEKFHAACGCVSGACQWH